MENKSATDVILRFNGFHNSLRAGLYGAQDSDIPQLCLKLGAAIEQGHQFSQGCIERCKIAMALPINDRNNKDLKEMKNKWMAIVQQHRDVRSNTYQILGPDERSAGDHINMIEPSGSIGLQLYGYADFLTRELQPITLALDFLVTRSQQYQQGMITSKLAINAIDDKWKSLRECCDYYIQSNMPTQLT